MVYGYPALLAAINQRFILEVNRREKGITVIPQQADELVKFGLKKIFESIKTKPQSGLEIKTASQIPIGCGLGSSAAAAVSLTAALCKLSGHPWNLEKINEIAYEIEKKQHAKPSGGDNTISTYGGFLWYRKEAETLKTFSQIALARKLPELFLINTGQPKETTGDMVVIVRKLYEQNPGKVRKIFVGIEQVTRSFLKHLTGEARYNIGDLFRESERLLEALGVVSESTVKIIRRIEKMGGAAKISGGGGKTGASGILLVYHQNSEQLKLFARKRDLDFSKVKLGEKGVRVEKEN